MDKVYKPVPDVEALRYHGTLEKPDIKIFVSHRIDQDSETIDNPLYIPVRCGAVYDDRENVTMLGDDTGDNISEKRFTYNELTVQYWAWKNVQADYYGLCHYRRYFSFATEQLNADIGGSYTGCVKEDFFNWNTEEKYGLNNDKLMSECISKSNITIFEPFDVRKAGFQTIKQSMSMDARSFDYHDMEQCIEIIKELYPEIYPYAKSYLEGYLVIFYNCFIMSRELFNELCDFEFSVLFKLEDKIDISKYSLHKQRIFGLIGEHLVGIWLAYKRFEFDLSVDERKVVYFDNINKRAPDLTPAYNKDNVTIVLASSDYFAPYLGVCIKSIIATSTQSHNYDLIVLEREISDVNKRRILSMKSGFPNISIRFLNVREKVANLHFYINGDRLSQETYYGLLTSWFLPNHSKAIIMDCDMIVRKDMAELYANDISNVMAGAVRDVVFYGLLNDTQTDTYDYVTKELGVRNPYNYFNGGLVFLNMEKFRRTFSLDKISECINKYKLRIVDQDMFNMLLEDNVMFLDPRWNHMIVIDGWVKNNLSYAPASDYLRFEEARKDPYIIHYANVLKPWNDPTVEFADDFWAIAKMTPFYETIIYRSMHEITDVLHQAVFDVGQYAGLYDRRTGARKVADFFFPKGSKRRELLKKIIPKGSKRWAVLKQIYYVFNPRFKRPMREDIM